MLKIIDHRSAIDQRSALGKGLEGARGSGLVAQAVYSIFASHWHAVLCTDNGWSAEMDRRAGYEPGKGP